MTETPVWLTAEELLLLRQRLSDGPGTPAVDSVLDAKLSNAQRRPGRDERDYDLIVTVRVYGGESAGQAAQALKDYRSTFDLPHDGEAEILDARPADD